MVGHANNLSTWKAEEARQGLQGKPQLHNKYKTTLGYIWPPVSKKVEEKTGKMRQWVMLAVQAWGSMFGCPEPM